MSRSRARCRFAKLWLMAAHFEVRQLALPAARRLLGTAIGLCPKEKLFKGCVRDVRTHFP